MLHTCPSIPRAAPDTKGCWQITCQCVWLRRYEQRWKKTSHNKKLHLSTYSSILIVEFILEYKKESRRHSDSILRDSDDDSNTLKHINREGRLTLRATSSSSSSRFHFGVTNKCFSVYYLYGDKKPKEREHQSNGNIFCSPKKVARYNNAGEPSPPAPLVTTSRDSIVLKFIHTK